MLSFFIHSNNLPVNSFRLSTQKIISSANSDRFVCFFFFNLCSFFSFSCLTALGKMYDRSWDRSSDGWNPCLILNFKGNAFNIKCVTFAIHIFVDTFLSDKKVSFYCLAKHF